MKHAQRDGDVERGGRRAVGLQIGADYARSRWTEPTPRHLHHHRRGVHADVLLDAALEQLDAQIASAAAHLESAQARHAADGIPKRRYLRATGRRRPIVRLWLPGKVRAGANLAPDRAVGRRSREELLAARRE